MGGSVTVTRYNGGAQAGHNVVCPDGTHHTFAQFGSGTFAGAKTHLSSFMLVNPITFLAEAKALQKHVPDCYRKVTVERGAPVTNPFQVAASRLRELSRSGSRHGSCGLGINETVVDFKAHPDEAIRVSDLVDDGKRLLEKLEFSRQLKLDQIGDLPQVDWEHPDNEALANREWGVLQDERVITDFILQAKAFTHLVNVVGDDYLRDLLKTDENVVFEGAQGVLLDEEYGFFPHCTRSKTTFANAFKLLEDADYDVEEATRLGVLRAYTTRHGAGPFPTEDPRQTCGEDHNKWGPWQQSFRTGHLDLLLVQYALDVIGGVDELALTCLDHIVGEQKICIGYEGCPDHEQFESGNGRKSFTGITHLPHVDLQRQERLTESFRQAKPYYRTTLMTPGVEDLGVSVTIESHGPTALDKVPAA